MRNRLVLIRKAVAHVPNLCNRFTIETTNYDYRWSLANKMIYVPFTFSLELIALLSFLIFTGGNNLSPINTMNESA